MQKVIMLKQVKPPLLLSGQVHYNVEVIPAIDIDIDMWAHLDIQSI